MTTEADVVALRRIRAEDRARYSLDRIREMQPLSWEWRPNRSTSEGWEPFEL
ncbi:MAG: hypothetical protein AAGF23_25970 [Acidobacteriota bacterium]